MENKKMKVRRPGRPGFALKQSNEIPGLEELRQSHRILQALIALIPMENRDEFLKLLLVLDKKGQNMGGPQDLPSTDRRRILQMVPGNDSTASLDNEAGGYGPERRMGDRRKGDRRQPVNNFGKPWTPEQIETLRTLAIQNTPIRRIALKLGRTTTAIHLKAKEIGLPLNLII
jgi:hypothetical protein